MLSAVCSLVFIMATKCQCHVGSTKLLTRHIALVYINEERYTSPETLSNANVSISFHSHVGVIYLCILVGTSAEAT
jgi:hypothetical protein